MVEESKDIYIQKVEGSKRDNLTTGISNGLREALTAIWESDFVLAFRWMFKGGGQ